MIKEINTIDDVKLFAFQLVNDENLSFHPDDDFSDYSITTSGKYQIVEKTICQFFDEYSKAFKDDKFENSNFENSKKLLQKDSIMDRIEKTGVSSEYIELYRNYFYGDTDLANWLENQIKD